MNHERQLVIAGNWKMHKLRREAKDFCRHLLANLDEEPAASLILYPSYPLLADVAAELDDSRVSIGGQDIHPAASGAHTGDVSGAQLIDAGCSWVLCGHSERRADHGESDSLVARKAEAALQHGLTPMICVGETAAQREAGQTFEVLNRQLEAVFSQDFGEFALAYEPVWAIGSGQSATPELAQEVHAFLRQRLSDLVDPEQATWIPILYGGSVKPGNAAGLIVEPDIDGFLIGGASLDPDKFLAIIRQAALAA